MRRTPVASALRIQPWKLLFGTDAVIALQASGVVANPQQDERIIYDAARAWLLPPRHLLAAGFSAAASAAATPSSVRITAQLATPQLGFLGDCHVLGRPLMPAAAWAEMLAAGCSALVLGDCPDGGLVLADAVLGTTLDLQAAAVTGGQLQSQIHLVTGWAEVSSAAASSGAAFTQHMLTRMRHGCPVPQRVTAAGRSIHLRVRMQVLGSSAAIVAAARSSLAGVCVPEGQLDSTGFAVHPGSAEAAASLGALPGLAECGGALPLGLAAQWEACLPRTADSRHPAAGGCTVQAAFSEQADQLDASMMTVNPVSSSEMLCLTSLCAWS